MMKIFVFISSIFALIQIASASPGGFCNQSGPFIKDAPLRAGSADFSNMTPLLFSVDSPSTEALSKEDLPREWDWRDHQGQNWLTSVKKQISCGDCVMHAVASVFESQLKINSGWSRWEPELSINEGFHCGGGDCSKGWWAIEALQRGVDVGFLDKPCGQQVASAQDCSLKECSTSSQRRWNLQGFDKVTDGALDINAIRRALLHGPVLTGFTLPEDFACYRWGVYKKAPDVNFLTVGHMVAIVGFSAKRKAWIVKNSWGEDWANRGYGYLYVRDTTNFGTESWSLHLPKNQGLLVEDLKNGDVFSGKKTLSLRNLAGENEKIFLHLQNSEMGLSHVSTCMGPTCSIEMDTTKIEDGTYEVYASIDAETSSLKSMVKTVQILNGSPLWVPLNEIRHLPFSLNSLKSTKWSLPIPFATKPSYIVARFISTDGNLLLEQKTRGLNSKFNIELIPGLVPKGSKLLEFWFQIEGHAPFLYSRHQLPTFK